MLKKKKKVAILTRHSVPNYGSFLQTLATQQIMEEMSFDPVIIDYRRYDETTNYLIQHYTKEHNNIMYLLYYNIFWRLSHKHIDDLLEKERECYLKCSDLLSKDTIRSIYGQYDLYLTGSDQVWNLVGSGDSREIDPVYFWDGLDSSSNIISYAASFGDSSLDEKNYSMCKEMLKKFKYISVREDSGVELLNEMGYQSTQVLDPTLIIDKEFWNNIADKSKMKLKDRYALIYNLHSDSNMLDSVKNDLKNSGLQVYSITTTFRRGLGKNVFCPSIEDFLWLFKNASCIYADSFHAIAFSIIFNTPFISTLPKDYSTRLESILRLFKLENCIASNDGKKGWEENRINWNEVNDILARERKKSKEWLINSVESLF